MITSEYLCFRSWAWDHEPEVLDQIGLDAQRMGGWIEPGSAYVDFVVPRSRLSLFVLRWHDHVQRVSSRDYV